MIVRAAVLLAVGLVISGSSPDAPAAQTAATAASSDCVGWEHRALAQSQMNRCSADDALRSGRDVAKRYLAYRATLTGGRRSALDATQRAWAAYRDTYCAERGAAVSGGSIQPLVINRCMETLNRRRAYDLADDRNAP